MTTDAAIAQPPRAGRLTWQVLLALGLGTALTVLVVLPAEYGVDPTGFGRLTGLVAISAPPEVVVETKLLAPAEVARVEPVPFREDKVSLEIGAFGESLGALEYKVSLDAGQTMLYSWRASKPVIFEFHGHTQPRTARPSR